MGAGPLAPSICGPGSFKSSTLDKGHDDGEVAGSEASDVAEYIKQEEEMWVFDRLARKCLQEEETAREGHAKTTSVQIQKDPVLAMGILKTRRVLRTLGLPTHGMKDELTNRLSEAIASGVVEAFVRNSRSTPCTWSKNELCSTLIAGTPRSNPLDTAVKTEAQSRKAYCDVSLVECLIGPIGRGSGSPSSAGRRRSAAARTAPPACPHGGTYEPGRRDELQSMVKPATSATAAKDLRTDATHHIPAREASDYPSTTLPATSAPWHPTHTPSAAAKMPQAPAREVVDEKAVGSLPRSDTASSSDSLATSPPSECSYTCEMSTPGTVDTGLEGYDDADGNLERQASAAAPGPEGGPACPAPVCRAGVPRPVHTSIATPPAPSKQRPRTDKSRDWTPRTPPLTLPSANQEKDSTPPTAPATPLAPAPIVPPRSPLAALSYLKESAKRKMFKFFEHVESKRIGREDTKEDARERSKQDVEEKRASRTARASHSAKPDDTPPGRRLDPDGKPQGQPAKPPRRSLKLRKSAKAEGSKSPTPPSSASPKVAPRKGAAPKKTGAAASPQRWGPPRAAPLTKSASAPSRSLLPATTVDEIDDSPPPEPANVTTKPRAPTSSETAAIPKQRWGPPRAAPLLEKSISADPLQQSRAPGPSQRPLHPKTPTSPAVAASRKVPAMKSPIRGAGGKSAPRSSSGVKSRSPAPRGLVKDSRAVRPAATRPLQPQPTAPPSTLPAQSRQTPEPRAVPLSNPLLPNKARQEAKPGFAAGDASRTVPVTQPPSSTTYGSPISRLPMLEPIPSGTSAASVELVATSKAGQMAHGTAPCAADWKRLKAKEIQVFYASSDDDDRTGIGRAGGKGGDKDPYSGLGHDSSSEEDEDPVLAVLEPKVTPEWAMPERLAKVLDLQFGGDKPVNPNQIFVEFFTCSLESIFDIKKKKWARSSTGDWMIDRLTISEQLAYERAMGYVAINLDQGIGGKRRPSVRRDSRRAKQ